MPRLAGLAVVTHVAWQYATMRDAMAAVAPELRSPDSSRFTAAR